MEQLFNLLSTDTIPHQLFNALSTKGNKAKAPPTNHDGLVVSMLRNQQHFYAKEALTCSLERIIDESHDGWVYDNSDDPFTPSPVCTAEEPTPSMAEGRSMLVPGLLLAKAMSGDDDMSSKKRTRDKAQDIPLDPFCYQERAQSHQIGKWAKKYQDLLQFRSETGHCLVSRNHTELSLVRWVKRQRYQYKLHLEGNKTSSMTQVRIQALEDIDFVWDSQGAAWLERLNELQEFRRTHKHCNVSSSDQENLQLGTWVKCQRRQLKLLNEGKMSSMTPYREQALDNLGFEWEIRGCTKARRRS
jgi:hypothetical protein